MTSRTIAPSAPDESAPSFWRLYTERTLIRPRNVRPDCTLGVLLQNLTIDAHEPDDLLLRLHATQAGLRDEGLRMALPALEPDTRLLGDLGPRFSADTVARLRRLACPLAAGALTLALATDNNAPWLAATRIDWTDPHGRCRATVERQCFGATRTTAGIAPGWPVAGWSPTGAAGVTSGGARGAVLRRPLHRLPGDRACKHSRPSES